MNLSSKHPRLCCFAQTLQVKGQLVTTHTSHAPVCILQLPPNCSTHAIAARGLDISDVDWVVQFDAPQDPNFFVHR